MRMWQIELEANGGNTDQKNAFWRMRDFPIHLKRRDYCSFDKFDDKICSNGLGWVGALFVILRKENYTL